VLAQQEQSMTVLSKRIALKDNGVVRYYWMELGTFWNAGVAGAVFIGMAAFLTPQPTEASILFGIQQSLMLIFWLMGLVLLYFAAGMLMNYTEFQVGDSKLVMQHKPLPWRGNRSFAIQEIDRISIQDQSSNQNLTYNVALASKNGSITRLASDLTLTHSGMLVKELQKALGQSFQEETDKQIAIFKKAEIAAQTRGSAPFMLIIVFLIGVFTIFSGISQLLEWRAIQNWPSVMGKVVEVKVEPQEYQGSEFNSEGYKSYTRVEYIPSVTYQYIVNRQTYTSQVISLHSDVYSFDTYTTEFDARQAVTVDTPVTVYYDPDLPENALLRKETLRSVLGTPIIGVFLLGYCGVWAVWNWYQKNRNKTINPE
jgi:hypothetical protein